MFAPTCDTEAKEVSEMEICSACDGMGHVLAQDTRTLPEALESAYRRSHALVNALGLIMEKWEATTNGRIDAEYAAAMAIRDDLRDILFTLGREGVSE